MLPLPRWSLPDAAVFGVAGLVIGLLGLLVCRRRHPDRAGPSLALPLLGLISLGVGSLAAGSPAHSGWPLLALAVVLLLFWAARSDQLARAVAAVWARARSPRWQWAALTVGSPVAAVLLGQGTVRHADDCFPFARLLPPGTVLTDQGRDVPVAALEGSPGPAENLLVFESGLNGRVIQVAPADWSYNCHGWIFTGGHYLLPYGDVEAILQDNGYRPLEHPEVGDLVVYRDGNGSICHSALVCAVRQGGEVLLESKWGTEGRYVHSPEATPYGQSWTYYRSPRGGHQLAPPIDHSRTAPALLH